MTTWSTCAPRPPCPPSAGPPPPCPPRSRTGSTSATSRKERCCDLVLRPGPARPPRPEVDRSGSLRWTVTAVMMVAAAPVTVVAVVAVTVAWLRGWPPARLRRAAAWSLPMTAAYLIRAGRHDQVAAGRAGRAVRRGGGKGGTRSASATPLQAFVLCAPVAVPAGLLIASWAWGARIYRIETGLAGQAATAPVDLRPPPVEPPGPRRPGQEQGARQRPADRTAGPDRDRQRHPRASATGGSPSSPCPATAMGRHQVIIGSSGSAGRRP